MNASAKCVIWIKLVEDLDEVVVAITLVEEEGKIDCSDNLELLSEVFVLTLHVTDRVDGDLLITEEESIIIQTELANCNDLSHFLSFLRKRNQLSDDRIRLFLLELTTTRWMDANGGVQTWIRLRQSQCLLGFLQITSCMSRKLDTIKPVIMILDTPTFQARSSTSFRSFGCFTFPR